LVEAAFDGSGNAIARFDLPLIEPDSYAGIAKPLGNPADNRLVQRAMAEKEIESAVWCICHNAG